MKKFFTMLAGIITVLFSGACCTSDIEVPANAVLLDVRSEAEFAERSIPGSIVIPHDRIAAEISAKIPGKDQPIVVYCRSGRRSAIAAKTLRDLGYTQVTDLGSIENAAKILKQPIISNR